MTLPSTYFFASASAPALSPEAFKPPTTFISLSMAAGSLSNWILNAPVSLPFAAGSFGSQMIAPSSIKKPIWIAASWLYALRGPRRVGVLRDRLLREQRFRSFATSLLAVRIVIEVAHGDGAATPFVGDGAPVRQRLSDGAAALFAVVARVDDDVHEVGKVKGDLASGVGLSDERREIFLHRLLHGHELVLPGERVLVDARERHVETGLVVAGVPVG